MSIDEDRAPSSGKARLPRNVTLLGWASLLNDVASEMIFPLLPQFLLTVLGGSRLELGVIEGAADTVASVVKLWSGARSDRSGSRKPFVVSGYAIAVTARALIAFTVAPWQLFAARIGDRTGKGVRTSPRDAMIADAARADARGRAFGFQRGMDHLGAAIGPALAAAFLWYWPGQLRWLFLAAVIPGACAVGLVGLGLRDRARCPDGAEGEFRFTLRPFGSGFRVYLVAMLVFTLGNSSDLFLLVRAEELGVAPALLPAVWGVFHVAKSAGSMMAGPYIDRLGPRRVVLLAWPLYAATYLAMAVATRSWHAWALFVAYAGYYALAEPAEKTLVANLVPRAHHGLAFGWFNLVVGLAALPASVVFGALYQSIGALAAFGWGAALAVAASLILLRAPTTAASDEPS